MAVGSNPEAQMLWADVGERLGLDKTALRNLRTTFSDVLGLDNSKTVYPSIVPVLERIHLMRQRGVPDDEIRANLAGLPKGKEWPEEVLARMEAAATAKAAVPLPATTPEREPAAASATDVELPRGAASGQPSEAIDSWVPGARAAGAFLSSQDMSEQTLREIVFDLRREIATNAMSERELVLHLMQKVQKLAIEVRDLRYAFLLASSRKDRKKGIKAISRLLSG